MLEKEKQEFNIRSMYMSAYIILEIICNLPLFSLSLLLHLGASIHTANVQKLG